MPIRAWMAVYCGTREALPVVGYCQIQLKKNKEACANFAKAKELGDEVVDGLIQKYCK